MTQYSHVLVVGIDLYIFIVADSLWVGEGVPGVIISPQVFKST